MMEDRLMDDADDIAVIDDHDHTASHQNILNIQSQTDNLSNSSLIKLATESSEHLPSPNRKTRSLSDGGGTPAKVLPSPLVLASKTSKDDSNINDYDKYPYSAIPVTPRRRARPPTINSNLPHQVYTSVSMETDMSSPIAATHLLSSIPPVSFVNPATSYTTSSSHVSQSQGYSRPAPPSPRLDLYASPTSTLPRRSRGLDFSRAATSLHHSTLAGPTSPCSSPIMNCGGDNGGSTTAANIPVGWGTDNGNGGSNYRREESTSSLWSMMGSQERMNLSSSIGSTPHAAGFDSSSSSSDDDAMDEDMDETYVTTPQATRSVYGGQASSPANSMLNFQQRRRPRKAPKKRLRGPLGLGFSNSAITKSPPSGFLRDSANHPRRDSITWQANRLNLSTSESEDNSMQRRDSIDGVLESSGTGSVIRKVVTRRGNLLPKTKNFARIRAALMEEVAPVESEFRREAEVVRQVRDSDVDLERQMAAVPPITTPVTATTAIMPSPGMLQHEDSLDDVSEVEMMPDPAMSLTAILKQRALRNPKAKNYWDTMSDTSSNSTGPQASGTGCRNTPPPPPLFLTNSSSNLTSDDQNMDSASSVGTSAAGGFPSNNNNGNTEPGSRRSSETNMMGGDSVSSGSRSGSNSMAPSFRELPSAIEITKRINGKRRRDDDFDPSSVKRRAVSPGVSAHNSPITQSPMQREHSSWGSRPGSNAGDRAFGGTGGTNGPAKGRIGLQGMTDTHDGIMRMSIE